MKFLVYSLWFLSKKRLNFDIWKRLNFDICNSVWLQCNDLLQKRQVFILWKILKWVVDVIKMFYFCCWKQIHEPVLGFCLTVHSHELITVKILKFSLAHFDLLAMEVHHFTVRWWRCEVGTLESGLKSVLFCWRMTVINPPASFPSTLVSQPR